MSDLEVSSYTVSTDEIDRYPYDVVVVGAGGSGLRAAIEARLAGKKTAIISKSLFGKAHTVMAEGGAAAAMGNVNSNDNWMVHFRDTMRGGKFLNNFSSHPVRYWAWTKVSWLNARHMQFAWITLGTLMLTDLYIWLVAAGVFNDPRIFN